MLETEILEVEKKVKRRQGSEEVEISYTGFYVALQILEEVGQTDGSTVGDLMQSLGDREHSILMILICLIVEPFPFVASIGGPIIFILALLQYRHRQPWLPEVFRRRRIKPRTLRRATRMGHRAELLLRKIIHPRWEIWIENPLFRFVNFVVLALASILLTIPLFVPLTDLLPVLIILFLALGQLEEDGVLVLISYGITVATVLFFYSVGVAVLKYFPGLTS